MSTVADYVNRTVDLLAFQNGQAGGTSLTDQQLAGPGERGEVIAGIAKLAQRWLVEFLTIAGSVRALPLRGSRFISDMRTGAIRTILDAEQSFELASKQVARNLIGEEEEGIPDDEAYAGVRLENITIGGDTLTVEVTLTSKAGTQVTVLTPITVKLM